MARKPTYEELEQRVRELEKETLQCVQIDRALENELRKFRFLYELAIAMTAEHSLDENLRLVVEKGKELLHADTSYIALRDEALRSVQENATPFRQRPGWTGGKDTEGLHRGGLLCRKEYRSSR